MPPPTTLSDYEDPKSALESQSDHPYVKRKLKLFQSGVYQRVQ